MKISVRLIAVLLCLLLLSMPQPDALAQNGGYRLSPGDELNIHVKGEDDLSGPVRISSDGAVTLPLGGAAPGRSVPAGPRLPEA